MAAPKSPFGRAMCSRCSKEISLRADGRLREHNERRPQDHWSGYAMPRCDGSGTVPEPSAITMAGRVPKGWTL